MSPPRATRRSLLRTGGTIAAVFGTGTLAGCIDGLGNTNSAGQDQLADVPPTADTVFTVDVNTFLADDGVRNTFNAWMETRSELDYYDGPETLEGTLDEFAEQEGLDLRDLSRFVGFFSLDGDDGVSGNDGTGYVFEGGWDVDELVDMFDHDYVEYTESTYGDHTVYEPDDEYTARVGVIEDGLYVAGGPEAVRSAIDVGSGETDPIDGPVATAYSDTSAGPVRFASDVRAEWFPEDVEDGEISLDLSPLRSLETAAGSIYREGTTRGLRVTLNAPDASTGEELETVVDGLLTLANGQAENLGTPGYVADLLEDVEISRDGPGLALSVERSIDELEAMAEEFGEYTNGSASGTGGSSVESPQVAFEFEYEADARTAAITHTSGDTIPAENLALEGDGFAAVDGVDMTAPGTWAGTTTDGDVVAGDRVTVGAEPDATLIVYWDEDDASATLSHWEGPEA